MQMPYLGVSLVGSRAFALAAQACDTLMRRAPVLGHTTGPWGSLVSLGLWEPLTPVQIRTDPLDAATSSRPGSTGPADGGSEENAAT